jgi:hypothetical protein
MKIERTKDGIFMNDDFIPNTINLSIPWDKNDWSYLSLIVKAIREMMNLSWAESSINNIKAVYDENNIIDSLCHPVSCYIRFDDDSVIRTRETYEDTEIQCYRYNGIIYWKIGWK